MRISNLWRFVWAITVAVIVLMAIPSFADVVMLHNGDRLTGTVSGVDAEVLTLQTDFAGELNIKRDTILSVTTDEPRDVGVGEVTYTGRLVDADGGQGIETDSGTEAIALADVTALMIPGMEKDTGPSWSGYADAGMTVRSGSTDTVDMLFKAETTRATERTKFTLRGAAAYGEADDVINTRRYMGETRLQLYPRDRLYFYGLASAERDDGRKLDSRYIAGGGVGYDWIENDKRALSTESGLEYVWERWAPFTPWGEDSAKETERAAALASLRSNLNEIQNGLTPGLVFDVLEDIRTLANPLADFDTRKDNYLTARLAARYEETFFDKITLNDHLVILPNLGDTGEFRLTNDLGITTPLTKSLGLRIGLFSEYDSQANDIDIDDWDHTLTTGLRYEFGKD